MEPFLTATQDDEAYNLTNDFKFVRVSPFVPIQQKYQFNEFSNLLVNFSSVIGGQKRVNLEGYLFKSF